MTPEKALGYH